MVNALAAVGASKLLQLILKDLVSQPQPRVQAPLHLPNTLLHTLNRLSCIQDSHTHIAAFLRPPSPPTLPLDSAQMLPAQQAAPMAPTAPRLRPKLLEHLRPLTVFTRSWNCLLMVTFSLEVHAGMDSTLSLCPELLNKCLLSIGLSRCRKRGGKEKSRHDCVPTTCQACTRASYHHVGGAVPTARLLLEQAWDMWGAGGQTDQK